MTRRDVMCFCAGVNLALMLAFLKEPDWIAAGIAAAFLFFSIERARAA